MERSTLVGPYKSARALAWVSPDDSGLVVRCIILVGHSQEAGRGPLKPKHGQCATLGNLLFLINNLLSMRVLNSEVVEEDRHVGGGVIVARSGCMSSAGRPGRFPDPGQYRCDDLVAEGDWVHREFARMPNTRR
jgi:hypothetical protein